jgi:predicted Fe-Mo cluster-binding NifX family protein
MKIAVTSQNFRTVTGHAGKSRRFLVFELKGADIREVDRLDLPMGMSMHDHDSSQPHPLDDTDALITGGCGSGFIAKMASRNIRVFTTDISDPQEAVMKLARKM